MVNKRLISFSGDDNGDGSVFGQIVELLGGEDAEELATFCGGERIRLPAPSKLTPSHPLCQRIGYELACRVVETVSPETGVPYFYVPKLTEIRIVRLLEESGMTTREVAQRTGVSQRTVHRYRKRMRAKGVAPGDHTRPKTLHRRYEINKGEKIVRTLLQEGHSPSQIRDILAVPGEVVLSLRAELLREGNL